jgi:hypothetical protein
MKMMTFDDIENKHVMNRQAPTEMEEAGGAENAPHWCLTSRL